MAEKERNTGECQIQNSQIADEFLQNYTEQAAQKLPVFLQDGYSVLSCYYEQEEKSCYLLQKKETKEKYIVKCRKEREDRDSLQKEYEELGRLAERYPNLYQRQRCIRRMAMFICYALISKERIWKNMWQRIRI